MLHRCAFEDRRIIAICFVVLMIICKLSAGGLGSQLFQIATTLALAWDNNDSAVFDLAQPAYRFQGRLAKDYRDSLYQNLEILETGSYDSRFEAVYRERSQHYHKIPYSPGLLISGQFMSAKYFEHHRQRLLETLNLTNLKQTGTTAIHIRRGDYLRLNKYHRVLDLSYYLAAIDLANEREFLIFSDDLPWCRQHFQTSKNMAFNFFESTDDLDALKTMAGCDRHIIANSTFSWWAAWIANRQVTIAPKQWYGERLNHLVSDIYTERMLLI